MKVILAGLHGGVSAPSISAGLAPFFHVRHVEVVRQGTNGAPWAIVEVDNAYAHVWDVCSRLRGVFHRGKALHLYIPLHQEDVYHDIPPHERVDIA